MKDLKELTGRLQEILTSLKHYAVLAFILLIAASYGFLVMRINSLQSIPPSTTTSSPVVVTPHIDPTIVAQLKQLQDNSVCVKALFDQARSNPFQDGPPVPASAASQCQ